MSDRRNFLKVGLAAAASATGLTACNTMSGVKEDSSSAGLPPGLIFTRENPGLWAKKVGGHVPEVTVSDSTIKVVTNHGMSKKHYIVRHTLVSMSGEVLASHTFYPTDDEPISEFEKPAGHKELYATSFCNKHDMWVSKFTV